MTASSDVSRQNGGGLTGAALPNMKPWTGKPLPNGYADINVVVQFRNGSIGGNGIPLPAKYWRWEWHTPPSSWDIVAYRRAEGE